MEILRTMITVVSPRDARKQVRARIPNDNGCAATRASEKFKRRLHTRKCEPPMLGSSFMNEQAT
jgi:hypothetical protein